MRAFLYLAAFLMDLGAFCGFSMMFLLLKNDLGASLTTQGLLALMQSVVYLSLCPLTSRLAGTQGRRIACLVAGPLVLGAAYLLIGQATAVWQVGGLMWVTATAAALFWPQLEAEIGHGASGALLGRRLGHFNLSWSVGSTLAPALGGLLYTAHHRLPFLATFLFGIGIAAVAAAYAVSQRRRGAEAPAEAPGGSATPAVASKSPSPVLAAMPPLLVAFVALAWFGNFLAFANQGVARSLFQNLGDDLGYTARQIGLLMTMVGVFRTAAFIVLQTTHAWAYRARYLFIFQGLMLVGVGCLCLPGGMWLAGTAMGLLGLSSAMAYTASMFYSVEGSRYGKSSTGLHESVLGAGGAFGMLVAGQMAPRLMPGDPRSPFYACAALTVVGLAVQGGLFAWQRLRGGARRAAPAAEVLPPALPQPAVEE
jgi:MFS family permease